jgi:hypothetical protein
MATLKVSSPTAGLLFELSQNNGQVIIEYCNANVKGDVDRYVDHGLDEWFGYGINAQPRHTPPNSDLFLPRLRDYLQRQFHEFTYELT